MEGLFSLLLFAALFYLMISWKSFFLGLVESYGYGWYFALIRAPLYNFFAARTERQSSRVRSSEC